MDKSDLEILGCQNFQSNISKIELNNFVAHHFSEIKGGSLKIHLFLSECSQSAPMSSSCKL